MTVIAVAVFIAEIATYIAVGMACWRAHPALAAVVVVAMAVWWGTLHSPRAPRRLPWVWDVMLRCAWFGIGLACLVADVHHHSH